MLIGHSLINRMSCAGLLLHCGAFAASIGLTDVRTFPVPFGDGVNQLAINDVGDIAGTSFSLTRPPAGFVIPANGSAPSQIVKAGAQFTYVNGINNQGTLVGFYRDSSGFPGFSYSAGVFAPI